MRIIRILVIVVLVGVIFKDIFLVYGNFKNKYLQIIDILVTLTIPVFSILTMLVVATLNTKGKIEIDGLNIFLLVLVIFSILKLIYVYVIRGKFYWKVFFIGFFTLISAYILYVTLNV
jgi:hypothetical protein